MYTWISLYTRTCPMNQSVAMTRASQGPSFEKGTMRGSRQRYQRKYCRQKEIVYSATRSTKDIITVAYKHHYQVQKLTWDVQTLLNVTNVTVCTNTQKVTSR